MSQYKYPQQMNILLVRLDEPSLPTQKPTICPPLGLWSIKTYIEATSLHRVTIVDERMIRALDPKAEGMKDALKTGCFDIVGLSVQFSIQHDNYVTKAGWLAAHHRGLHIAGGFHASAVPAPKGIDIVSQGSGEATFAELLSLSLNGEWGCHNQLYRDLQPYWLAAPVSVDYQWSHFATSRPGAKWTTIETSRGCPNKCGYCGCYNYWGRWRSVNPDVLQRHIRRLADMGIEEVFIEDDNVAATTEHLLMVARSLKDVSLRWSTPNGIEAKQIVGRVGNLKASGCWRLSLPFETGSRYSASLMGLEGKWMDLINAKALVDECKGEGIEPIGFFIIGYPGETLDDMRRTLDYANALPLEQRNIYIATPYPGTHLYDICKMHGWLVTDGPDLYRSLLYTRGMIRTPQFDPEEVEELKRADREAAIARRQNKGRSSI